VKNILVLCTGNSCRSIMAEALINHLCSDYYNAESAGSSPVGYVHPKSVETLKRHGIEAMNPHSKSWNEFADREFDTVITVCDRAASENCPLFLGKTRRIHWSIPDPASQEGTEEEVDGAFEGAFQELKRRIQRELL